MIMRGFNSRRLGMQHRLAVAVLCVASVAVSFSGLFVSAQDQTARIPFSTTTGDSGVIVVELEATDDARDGGGDDRTSEDDQSGDLFTAAAQRYRMQLRNLKGNIFGMDPPPPKSKKGAPSPKDKKGSKSNDCHRIPDPKAKKGANKEPKGKGGMGRLCVPTFQPTQIKVTMRPTKRPTKQPVTLDTGAPTPVMTSTPTKVPTKTPTLSPTVSFRPTVSSRPTKSPTKAPTATPTLAPSPATMFQASSRFRSGNQWWNDDEFRPDTKPPTEAPNPDDGQPATLEPTQ